LLYAGYPKEGESVVAITNALASVAVKDLAKSVAWYRTLFGRVPDSTPIPVLAEWKFERGGWLQVYELKERAGAGSVTLAVDSLEDQIAALRQIGIDPGRPMISEKVKVVMIRDPDGNSIAFAQAIDPTMAH
jgi:catechol 2,3-dioxygenase-like lactoylglutathione lyase family enzyme